MAFVACSGDDGADGANGVDGTSCTVSDDGAGTTTIACDDGTTATVANGTDGENGNAGADGKSCTVADNDDGTMTISCDDGTSATVANGSNCTVANDGNGTTTISCDDGTSSTVTDGQDVDPATVDDLQAQLDALAKAGPESCSVCHKDAGEHHQVVYDDYADASRIALTMVGVTSVANATDASKFDATMTFQVTWDGMPYASADNFPNLQQKRFYTIRWDGTKFVDSQSFSNIKATGTVGTFTATATAMSYAPENSNAIAYGYIAVNELPTGPTGSHVTLYDDVSNAGKVYGTINYTSAANVAGCEKCHGAPYMKHGYRAAAVPGLPDFAACKTCHYDTRNGGHHDWQILVDNPARYAEIHAGSSTTTDEKAQYAYTANVMNDTHMSHAMEFPYPQSIANCVTCHEGKLDVILAQDKFKLSTCKSCHPMTGDDDHVAPAPAFAKIWADASLTHPNITNESNCVACHDGSTAAKFDEIHTGYNTKIYAEEDVMFSELFTVTIDEATFASNILTVKFSAHEATGSTSALNATDIIPTLMVGLYGYDSKDYIVGPHSRDADNNRLLEFVVDGTSTNPRFTTVTATGGNFELQVDLSMWETMIDDGIVKRAEIAIMPQLKDAAGTTLALNSPSRTFDLVAADFADDYFDDIVDVNKCNECHEALATTFHSANRGGNIRTCRLCHVTTSGGSHLEMQSRSIDSYVHAIHSFQAFDPGDIDFADPIEKTYYELHVEHTYPNFTIKNCESCHNPGTYNVPNQAKSMPGLLSKSDAVADRAIHDVPAYVTGPASRACGGCHRAEYINEDDANGLAAFNSHIMRNGYLIVDGDDLLELAIETIMSMF
ncbi:MAG: hypothetical protein EP329_05935 [Deltaproteobacteria bacterium]|nr:MAG: hypothetical protein EP329_05935 [Deltaproteobacteria bacterium]